MEKSYLRVFFRACWERPETVERNEAQLAASCVLEGRSAVRSPDPIAHSPSGTLAGAGAALPITGALSGKAA